MYTTNRCMPTPSRSPFAIFLIAISAVIFCASAVFSLNAAAQTRNFPASALRGSLQVTLPPQVEMDGKADQLSPGARIHGTNNLLVLSGSLVGQTMWVNYTRDTSGLLSEIWILTEAEAALERNGAKPKRFFFF
jgi:shikimate 5-dehydrogenase